MKERVSRLFRNTGKRKRILRNRERKKKLRKRHES
jgi:hypothetical protein